MEVEASEKQAVLYGAARMARNRELRTKKFYDFTDLKNDFEYQDDTEALQEPTEDSEVVIRKFKNFIEDWEEEMVSKKDSVHEARLLEKYKYIRFRDDEDDQLYEVAPENLEFKGKRRHKHYCVVGQPLGFKDGDSEDLLISRDINEDLHVLIRGTEQDPELHIDMEQRVDEEECPEDDGVVPETQEDDLAASQDAAQGSRGQDKDNLQASQEVTEDAAGEDEVEGDGMESDKDGAD